MKRILLLILMIIPLHIDAGNIYTIFRLTGQVKRSPLSSQEWKDAVRRDTVKLSDRVSIPEGGEIRILESGTGVIYSCSQTGETDVKHIIDISKESFSGTLGAVAGELLSEAVSKVSDKKSSRVHGATSRGKSNDKQSYEKRLAKEIIKGYSNLKLDLVPEDDHYKFRIYSRKPAKVCIVCFLPGSVLLCIPATGMIIPKGETILPFPEVVPEQDAIYHVFPFNEMFDEAELCRVLLSTLE